MVLLKRGLIGIVLALSIAGSASMAVPPQARNVSDGVFTEQQATRGQAVYKSRCATCHGDALAGRTGPPLTGDDFLVNWNSPPVLDLANKIRRTMPKDETARLTAGETADVLAYILQVGRFPVGRTELVADDATLKQMNFPARAVAAKIAK